MDLSPYIDHTLLRGSATKAEILKICEEAKGGLDGTGRHPFASVCVNSCWVTVVAEALAHTNVKVCSVVGFPLGAMSAFAKIEEASIAVMDGADEIDFVLNYGDLKSGGEVWRHEMTMIREAIPTATIKVILETCELTDEQIVIACRAAVEAGLDFVKTSTGFGKAGATVEHVKLMRGTVGEVCGVKASGKIGDYATAVKMIEAGADRLGVSASLAICAGAPADPAGEY